MRTRFVHRIGVEMEGGWLFRHYLDLENRRDELRVVRHGDGSVSVSARDLRAEVVVADRNPHYVADPNPHYVGEYVSRPIKVSELVDWMRPVYPDHVNSTCGMHVHLSFKAMGHYVTLAQPAFFKYFIDGLTAWATTRCVQEDAFWNRLRGGNRYCAREFRPTEQLLVSGKGGPRYTFLNYNYGAHQTIECRVLPMFKSFDLAVEAIQTVVRIFDNYLKAFHTRKKVAAWLNMPIAVEAPLIDSGDYVDVLPPINPSLVELDTTDVVSYTPPHVRNAEVLEVSDETPPVVLYSRRTARPATLFEMEETIVIPPSQSLSEEVTD